MAVTVTANLTDVDLAETNTDWSDGSTFGTVGTSLASGDGVFKQGTDSQSSKLAKNNSNWIQRIGTAKDMSGTDVHLYWWILTAIRPNMTDMEIRIGDSAGAYTGWTIDAFTLWDGSWKCFVQDLAATPDTSSGTIDLTDITIVSVLFGTVGSNFRSIENVWVDACRFGTGLTATGTAFDIADIAADDQLVANQYGILQNIDDVIFSQGKLQIGNGATTTTFTSVNEVLVFRDAPVSSTLYEFLLTGSGCDVDITSLTARAAGTTDGTRFLCDFSVANSLDMTGSAFTRAGLIIFAAGFDITNTVFNDCSQIDPSTGIFKLNTISNYVGTLGSVLYPSSDTNISGLTFIVCDNGVEYDSGSDATSPSFDDFTFDDAGGNYDVNNTSGSAVSIGNANGSNANSYNPGGDVVTFLANPVSFTVTAKKSTDGVVIEDAQINVEAGDALGDLFFEVVVTITSSGTLATVAHTAHGLVTGAKVNIRNAVEIDYIGAQTITVTGVNEYTYVMGNSTTSPATGTINATEMMVSGLSDVNGEITLSRPYTVDQLYRGFARKTDAAPFYKTANISGTLDKDLGATISANLTSDE